MKKQTPAANVKPFQPKGAESFKLIQIMSNSILAELKRRGQLARLGKQYGDKRDLYDVLGYLAAPTIDDYWNEFLRGDVAKRIVRAPVNAIWRKPPEITEDDDPDKITPFEQAWIDFQKANKIWSYFSRADTLAGIGLYGIMLLGMPGNLDQEVRRVTKGQQKLLFLSTYSQKNAFVESFVFDTTDQRFGKPMIYVIDLAGDLSGRGVKPPTGSGVGTQIGTTLKRSRVHYSRVIHFAEELLEDEVHGTPRLEAVFNRLYDLQKVVGGSAEGYWRGAYGGFALEAADDAVSAYADAGQIDPDVVDEFAHGMRRWMDVSGYKLNRIQGQDFKPKETFDVIMACVSAATGIPQRILMGSERGQLASTQDESNWKDFVSIRREEYAEPLIREFIDKMVKWGCLPAPQGEYKVVWESLDSKTDLEKSTEFSNYATGIKALAPGGQPELVITPAEVRTKYLDLEPTPAADMVIDPMIEAAIQERHASQAPAPTTPAINKLRRTKKRNAKV